MRKMFLFLCLISLLFSSCSVLAPAPEPVTIQFAIFDGNRDYYEALLAEFNQLYPYITVEIQTGNQVNEAETDIYQVGFDTMVGLDPADAPFLPLDEFMAQEKDFGKENFFPNSLEAMNIEGKQLGIPIGLDPWLMFYNKDLFDRYGIPYPQPGWTWSDFKALAQSMRYPEDRVYAYAPIYNYVDALFFLYQNGGALADANGVPMINDPVNVAAMEEYVGLYLADLAPTHETGRLDFGTSNNPEIIAIVGGSVAMFTAQMSTKGGEEGFPAQWNFNWGAVPLPRVENNFTPVFFQGLVISKASSDPQAAWKWVSFLSRTPTNRTLPARISVAQSSGFAEAVGDELAEISLKAMESPWLVSRQNIAPILTSVDMFFSAVDKIINSDVLIQEALDNAQNAVETQLQ